MGVGELLGQPDRMLGSNLQRSGIPSKEPGAMSQFGLKRLYFFMYKRAK